MRQIKGTGKGGIMSDDKNALSKLRTKLAVLEVHQKHMKDVNAYYRKHGTLDGGPAASSDALRQIEINAITGRKDAPYAAWMLSNNNANIRRIKERIAELEKEAQRAAENAGAAPVKGNGYTLIEDTAICRIQFIFDSKPDDETRDILKSRGFRWSPSQGAWQRLLNENGRYAAERVREYLDQIETIPQF